MEIDNTKIARLTGKAIQDDETFKKEGGFVPERDQYYFEMQQGAFKFLVGFKDLLTCLRLLEKAGEIPKIEGKWWLKLATLYGDEIVQEKQDYIKEYVPETEEPERHELYRIAQKHYDKAIYLLQKATGIYITLQMAETLAENYAAARAYNYIDATMYNIPWYLIYSHTGFPLYHMLVRKDTVLYRRLKKLGLILKDSKVREHIYVEQNEGYLLIATNYRYQVDADENLREWLGFSILRPDETVTCTLLYNAVDRFSVEVDSYHFGNLLQYQEWKANTKILEIAKKYMNP